MTKLRLAGAAALVCVAASACHRPGEDADAFQWTSELPAGSVIHIRDGAGDITVRPATGQSAVVKASRQWRRSRASDVTFVVNQQGNDYYVCAMWRGSGKCGSAGYRGRQTSGFFTMFSLFHRSNDATAAFVAEIPSNVMVDANTSNGSVHVDGILAGVMARTSNGSVRVANVGGPLTLSAANGDIRLTADSLAPADSIHLSTKNGSIQAELPANAEGNFDLSSQNGLVRSDFAIPELPNSRPGRHLRGQIGASTRVVRMRALNGTVTLLHRGGAQ